MLQTRISISRFAMCDGSGNNSRSCGLQFSIRGLNWILQCGLHQDNGHFRSGSNCLPRPQDCIYKKILLWASVYSIYLLWFVPVLCIQLITPNHNLTTPPCWPSAVKTLDNAGSLSHIIETFSSQCVSFVQRNIRQLEVRKKTDLRAIVIVRVPSIPKDTCTSEFPRWGGSWFRI